MTVEEIFSNIKAHNIKGLMVHSQMTDYFNFLSLKGYAKCQEYHYICESYNFMILNNYYLYHYNKMIPDIEIENPKVIPEAWYKYLRQEVNAASRKSGIQTGFERWVNWEKETKKLYEKMYSELCTLNEIAAAMMIKCYMEDVDQELKAAEQKYLELKAIDFDISDIIAEQRLLYEKYKNKMRK